LFEIHVDAKSWLNGRSTSKCSKDLYMVTKY